MNVLAIFDLKVGFAVTALAAFAANILQWAVGERHRIFYWPAGRFRWAMNALLAALLVLALLSLLQIVRGDSFLLLSGLDLIAASVFSIVHGYSIRCAARAAAVA